MSIIILCPVCVCLRLSCPAEELISGARRRSLDHNRLVDRKRFILVNDTCCAVNIVVIPIDMCRGGIFSRTILRTQPNGILHGIRIVRSRRRFCLGVIIVDSETISRIDSLALVIVLIFLCSIVPCLYYPVLESKLGLSLTGGRCIARRTRDRLSLIRIAVRVCRRIRTCDRIALFIFTFRCVDNIDSVCTIQYPAPAGV